MSLEKEKNKEIIQAKRMAFLRKAVLREIRKTEKNESPKKDKDKQPPSTRKKKIKSAAQKITTPAPKFKKIKASAVSKKEKLFISKPPAEKKVKIKTIPTDIKTNRVNVIFEKKQNSDKKCCFLSLLFKKYKSPSDKEIIKQKINIIILFIVGLILGCLLIFIAGFCIPKSDSAFARKISKIIPFPAIIIDRDLISYESFLKEVNMVNKFLVKQKQIGIIRELPAKDKIREDIANLLIRQKIIKKLAIQYEVSVTKKEIKDEIENIKQKSRAEEDVEKMLQNLYGWNEKDFGDKVIGPSLLSFKVAKAISPKAHDSEAKKVLDGKIDLEKNEMKIYILTD